MKNKPKVLMLGPIPPPHMGPTMATEIILNSRLKYDFDLIHLDTSDHRHLNTLNRIDLWNLFLAFKHYVQMLKMMIEHSPSLVYMCICQTTLGYFRDIPFIIIAKSFGCKVICHLRGGNFKNWYLSASPLTRLFVRRVHSLVDGQIVLGEKLRNLFQGILPDEKIFVVPNGADYFFDIEKRNFNTKSIVKVLFLSNLKREKGLFDILAAVPELAHLNKKIEFIFCGQWRDNETKKEFHRFLNEHLIHPIKSIRPLHGKLKLSLLLSADIFVFPPCEPEGHPWVIVEAMAAGLPIITTDQGAITESVKDGVNGFIVGKRNPHQIAEKIRFLIENPEVRKKMGEESRRLYLENFTGKKMIERLSYAFDSILSGKNVK